MPLGDSLVAYEETQSAAMVVVAGVVVETTRKGRAATRVNERLKKLQLLLLKRINNN